MKVEFKGENLVITIPATTNFKKLEKSKSGKTLTVASSGGFQETDLKLGDKQVHLNVNAFVYVEDKKK